MAGSDIDAVVATLWKATSEVPQTVDAQLDAAEGQSLQARVRQNWLDQGKQIGGWKVGMTSGGSRDAMGAGVRPFGYVLDERVLNSGARIPADDPDLA